MVRVLAKKYEQLSSLREKVGHTLFVCAWQLKKLPKEWWATWILDFQQPNIDNPIFYFTWKLLKDVRLLGKKFTVHTGQNKIKRKASLPFWPTIWNVWQKKWRNINRQNPKNKNLLTPELHSLYRHQEKEFTI